MARTLQNHKEQYKGFIKPDYAPVAQVNGGEIAGAFEAFSQARFAEIPDEGTPADGYMYNSHMGAFVRTLDQAKDHWLKGKLAFYAKRDSCTAEAAPAPSGHKQ